MCGICGFYQSSGAAGRRELEAMNRQIVHRGPDDEGYFLQSPVGLAARRLSIIDLQTGHQPLSSASGRYVIAFNGEIYNYRELRRDLESRGYSFRTRGDTEVVVNLFEDKGPDFVEYLNGMFAVAIYDCRENRLTLARDRVGIKPLYYYSDPRGSSLVFGSEIKSILACPGVSREVDPVAVDLFLSLEYIPAPLSIFRHIRKLPAGHLLEYEGREIKVTRYWDVGPGMAETGGAPREAFLELFRDAVHSRMISDVPLGAFLSGGVDSSAIVSQMIENSRLPVKTFSIGFEDRSYSELAYSRRVAGIFGTEHHVRKLSPDIHDLVNKLSWYFDEPLGDFSNFPTHLVSRTARERVTVALSGDGGDEIFGGYEHYIAQKVAGPLDIPPLRVFHRLLARSTHLLAPSRLKKGFVNRYKRFFEGLAHSSANRHFRWMLFLTTADKRDLYHPDFLNRTFLEDLCKRHPFAGHFENARRFRGINRDLYLDFKTYLTDNILVKVDRASMATSLEARVPFLDHRLVEFAFSLPSSQKVRGTTTKWFLKQSLEGILPPEIIHRRKEGFSIPIKNWLGGELKDLMMDTLTRERMDAFGFFHYPFIRKMMDEHLRNRQNHSHRLWSLILLTLWRDRFLKGDGA